MSKHPLHPPTEKVNRFPEDTHGQRIRKLRTDEGLSQKKLAELLGFTANYLGQVERNAKSLSKNMADAICNYFHVDYNYLYHGIRPAQPEEQDEIQENPPVYIQDFRTLLNEYIRNCSEEECQMLEPIFTALIRSIRETGWFDPEKIGQIKDES